MSRELYIYNGLILPALASAPISSVLTILSSTFLVFSIGLTRASSSYFPGFSLVYSVIPSASTIAHTLAYETFFVGLTFLS